MEDLRVGRTLRAVRRRLRLRQQDVADKAGVSQRTVAELELGRLDGMSLRAIRLITRVLEVDVEVDLRRRGMDLYRLLDERHAQLVDHVVGELRGEGWEVLVEHTFNHFGERGSADIVAWHAATRTLLIVEVKSRLVDLQETFSTFARKLRIVPQSVARSEGWEPDRVARVLVVLGTTANRRIVHAHAATFEATFPQRAGEFLAWLRSPKGPMGALWFVSPRTLAARRAANGQARRRPAPDRRRPAPARRS